MCEFLQRDCINKTLECAAYETLKIRTLSGHVESGRTEQLNYANTEATNSRLFGPTAVKAREPNVLRPTRIERTVQSSICHSRPHAQNAAHKSTGSCQELQKDGDGVLLSHKKRTALVVLDLSSLSSPLLSLFF